jgi:D-sedoheptulose 7-phosphate isomerase
MREIVVFTNGCFDILHVGHLDLLRRARELGTKLIVGINSDASVRALKGASRPIVSETDRAEMLRSLRWVDEVRIFNAPTPQKLIEEINPDVLVKGGDWKTEEIIGADLIIKNGGKIFSLPFLEGYSTSDIVEKILRGSASNLTIQVREKEETKPTVLIKSFKQHQAVFQKLIAEQYETIEHCLKLIWETLAAGKKVLICGNGGSAADAQHFAAELVGRFEYERRGFPSIALTTDSSALTAIGNDYGFQRIFARQVEALAAAGDVLIGISTSGNSPNIISAVMTARQIGCITIGMTGGQGKKLASLCDAAVLVPSERTARIQEAHITIIHAWCEMIDEMVCAT